MSDVPGISIRVFEEWLKGDGQPVNIVGAFDPLIERLRFWLIRKLAGDTPVILNCHVTVPTTLKHPGLYVGNARSLIVLSSIASDDELWSYANGVVETD
jgi:hypothetical protein